jgi:hypothetical protein|nr:MAG TPA: hypothetical protein [Caudoviricetes sp.]
MKVILDIHFNGKNINDIYNLPCVMAVTKDAGGKPAAILKSTHTKGRTIARIGDHIVKYESDLWQVYGPAASEMINKSGK